MPSWLDFLLGGGPQAGGTMPTSALLGADPMGAAAGTAAGAAGTQPGGDIDAASVINKLFSSPEFRRQSLSSALLGAAGGMLKASGPSTIPTGIGTALGGAFEGAQGGIDKQRDRFSKDMALSSQLEGAKLQRDTQRGWMDFMRQFAGAGQGGVPSIPRPASADEAQRLPPGTLFEAPDGTLRTR